uniref:Uncharacterized protein n=1 Tax=Oncorhynchus kisutch TaxID=8019 RepID=A0A8C7CAM9_ONCKI
NSIEILPEVISVYCFTPMSSSFQQRLSYTTLSDLGLLDVQHLNLSNQRQNLHCEHQGGNPLCAAHPALA